MSDFWGTSFQTNVLSIILIALPIISHLLELPETYLFTFPRTKRHFELRGAKENWEGILNSDVLETRLPRVLSTFEGPLVESSSHFYPVPFYGYTLDVLCLIEIPWGWWVEIDTITKFVSGRLLQGNTNWISRVAWHFM